MPFINLAVTVFFFYFATTSFLEQQVEPTPRSLGSLRTFFEFHAGFKKERFNEVLSKLVKIVH